MNFSDQPYLFIYSYVTRNISQATTYDDPLIGVVLNDILKNIFFYTYPNLSIGFLIISNYCVPFWNGFFLIYLHYLISSY